LRKNLLPVVRRLAFKYAIDDVKQFSGHGDDGLQLGFVAGLKSFVEGLQVRVPVDR
jgi:hypothetical protein